MAMPILVLKFGFVLSNHTLGTSGNICEHRGTWRCTVMQPRQGTPRSARRDPDRSPLPPVLLVMVHDPPPALQKAVYPSIPGALRRRTLDAQLAWGECRPAMQYR